MNNIQKIILTLVCTASTVFLSACASDSGSPRMVSDADWDSLTKLHSGKYTLIDSQQLTELNREASLGKNVGRFRTEREAFRTWRLDTATGETCLLLTSREDWKKPETVRMGCGE